MTFDRRSFLTACSRMGVASALFPGALYTLAAQGQEATGTDQSKPPKITPEMIDQAAEIAGVGPFTDEQKKMMIEQLVDLNGSMKAIRKLKMPNSVAPAFVFHPQAPPGASDLNAGARKRAGEFQSAWNAPAASAAPPQLDQVAFASVSELAG